ncbi:hypothetical protein HMPREF1554_01547 [Porphyromonas gingivalis F0569]|uniref:Uncharacterized protein n=1 Tax=Porphyromonas gingivalis F0570 TaxID=1227271 RepID=A0A0E2LRN7_PORGN|nr:hypothetical protein HMPREF1554_01547 [Porphyromonas gingivalis F0569]ERJ67270.1 hypothetical protein HMPREF1555_00834 [Porphyromonas gingivalis F0570]
MQSKAFFFSSTSFYQLFIPDPPLLHPINVFGRPFIRGMHSEEKTELSAVS